ncbi:MAG: ribonuclease Y, partial [candidate division KSB1 bacterium]|nr:ribonuclease Y [candidate division KSB1 bacterium]
IVQNAILLANDSNSKKQALTPASIVVAVANGISVSRPGAQKEVLHNYLQRLRQLEEICRAFPGVINTYALQAGREIRVAVEHTQVDDNQAEQLALTLAQKIKANIHYPGQIKVTVVREYRSVNFAK